MCCWPSVVLVCSVMPVAVHSCGTKVAQYFLWQLGAPDIVIVPRNDRSGLVRLWRARCTAASRLRRCACAADVIRASSAYIVQRSEVQFVDRGRQKALLRLGIVPALNGNASAMPPHAGISKQVDR